MSPLISTLIILINKYDLNRGGWLTVLMVVCGCFGGVVRNAYEKSQLYKLDSILLGVLASLLCPLFLKTISSDLLTKLFDKKITDYTYDLFLLSSIFLLAAFYSKSFIDSVRSKFMKDLDNVRHQTEENTYSIIKKSYLNLNNDEKEIIHNILIQKISTFDDDQLSSFTSLEGADLMNSLSKLMSAEFITKKNGQYLLAHSEALKELDKKHGPNYEI